MKISTSAARRCNPARAEESLKSTVTDRLFRFTEWNGTEAPCTKGGPHPRASSPPTGRSTLMTSAPKSARIPPANGPARLSPTSTTLTPDKGMCSSMALALATHGVELVIGAHVGKVGHAVGERKKGRDPANVPNIVVTEPEFPQRDEVRVLKLLRLQGHLEGEIEHRALAWGNVGLTIIHGHLVSNERILGIDAQDRAMRDHTVMTVIGATGGDDNHLSLGFGQPALLQHERVMIGEEGAELVRPMGQGQKNVGNKPGFLLHGQDSIPDIWREIFEFR